MPGPGLPAIVVNEFSDTITGHANVSFYNADGSLLATIGAQIDFDNNIMNGLNGGIMIEGPRTASKNTIFYLDPATFADTYTWALGRVGDGPYNLFGKNCVDFVIDVLDKAGVSYNIDDLFDYAPLDAYAEHFSVNLFDFDFLFDQMEAYNYGWMGAIDDMFAHYDTYTPTYWDPVAEAWVVTGQISGEADRKKDKMSGTIYSPIVIDLDGDGIETSRLTLSEEGGVRFDIDGNGTIDRLGWLTGDDAFLVRDLNGDGLITSGLEMFGGANRGEGFAELALLDSNGDGVLNAADDAFQSLSLWQDVNADGITDEGELISLSSVGLTQIELAYEEVGFSDHGNLLGERSTATINGANHLMVDVYFQTDLDYAL